MKRFIVWVKLEVQKQFELVNPIYKRSIILTLRGLSNNPYPGDEAYLGVFNRGVLYQIYRGPYKLVYKVDEETSTVEVYEITPI